MDESRSSTRSRSPVRRSSSSESSPRDGSPVNFSAALDTAENIRDRSLSMMKMKKDPTGKCRVSSGQGKVREIPDLAKVREKSGNFVEGQGKK